MLNFVEKLLEFPHFSFIFGVTVLKYGLGDWVKCEVATRNGFIQVVFECCKFVLNALTGENSAFDFVEGALKYFEKPYGHPLDQPV